MDDHTKAQSSSHKGAQKYFAKSAQGENLAKETHKNARNAGAAKIAKLRALRLAKEAVDKTEADRLAAQKAEAVRPTQRKRSAATKPVKLARMSY